MGTPLLHALWKWVHHYYMLYEKEEKKKKSGLSYDLLSPGLVVNQIHGQWSSCDSSLETFFYNRKFSDILLDTWWDDISRLIAEGSVIQKIQIAQSCSEDDNPCFCFWQTAIKEFVTGTLEPAYQVCVSVHYHFSLKLNGKSHKYTLLKYKPQMYLIKVYSCKEIFPTYRIVQCEWNKPFVASFFTGAVSQISTQNAMCNYMLHQHVW